MKRKVLRSLALALVLFFFAACRCDGYARINYRRSGDRSNAYIEEPLPAEMKQYEPALELSNQIIELLKKGDIEQIYSGYFHPRFQSEITRKDFETIVQLAKSKSGEIKAYKKMQWWFGLKSDEYVTSINFDKHVGRLENGRHIG